MSLWKVYISRAKKHFFFLALRANSKGGVVCVCMDYLCEEEGTADVILWVSFETVNLFNKSQKE